MKSSLVAVSAAVVVATLVTGLKDRAALPERFGLGPAGKPVPELMMMGRIKPADAPGGNSEFNAQLVADKLNQLSTKTSRPRGLRALESPFRVASGSEHSW
mgnify:CR=1 FL=1